MSLDLIVPYVGRAEFKDMAGIADVEDDTEIDLALSEGAEMIEQYCNRSFHVISETRPFDAPPSEWLLVGDLLEITSLTWYGTPLVVGTDYLLLPEQNRTGYDALLRVAGSPLRVYRWDQDPLADTILGLPWGKISIAGTWGFKGTYDSGTSTWTEQIPTKIARANVLLSARLWQMRSVHYSGDGSGGPGIGRKPLAPSLMSDEVKDLLNPYMRDPLPILVGSPYGD